MTELTNRLARDVHSKLRGFGCSHPTLPVLRLLFQTVYLASQKTEEGRFVRGSITFANPNTPEIDPPFTRRADYPAFTALKHHPPLTVELLVKLSRAIDKWSGSIAVYGTTESDAEVWGVVDQLVQQNVMLNRETETGFSNPGIITISMDGVGDVSAYSSVRSLRSRIHATD